MNKILFILFFLLVYPKGIFQSRAFHWKKKLHLVNATTSILAVSVQTFMATIRLVTCTESNPPHFLRLILIIITSIFFLLHSYLIPHPQPSTTSVLNWVNFSKKNWLCGIKNYIVSFNFKFFLFTPVFDKTTTFSYISQFLRL